jgi:hypothetical protein
MDKLELDLNGVRTRTVALLALIASAVLVATAPEVAGARPLTPAQTAQTDPASCVIHSLPAFIDQGELALEGTVGDIVEVECNPEVFPPGTSVEISDAQLFSRCSGGIKWVMPNEFATNALKEEVGRSITVGLDGDGNATVALVAGPHCAVGETVVSAHTGEPAFESVSTSFSVEGAKPTMEGVAVTPREQVESTGSSSVATIVSAEFPASGEVMLRVGSPELFNRCQAGTEKLTWLRMNKELVSGKELAGGTSLEPTGTEAIRLDDDGNGFVIAIGHSSCKAGKSIIEADLETSPFTTEELPFAILPPQPTAEPAFSIEKLQEIKGSGSGFAKATLVGKVGQTVDYEIVVKNTTTVPETFSRFTDADCDPGTIAGGPGASPVAPGESTIYTCDHVLTAVGSYVNSAAVTGDTIGGVPVEHTSNQVVVEVPEEPGFTIEKLQEVMGSGFTKLPLMGVVGATDQYEIVIKNTGNVPLTFSGLTDPHCDPGTIAGGPGASAVAVGESTIYTCSHKLAEPGSYTNEATVTGTSPGGKTVTLTSNQVVIEVPKPVVIKEPSFTVEKFQEINGSGFTTKPLTGLVGETVDYEIVVRNTGNVPLTFSSFTDPRCDPGTIAGGPGTTPVQPGASTTFTCSHVLAATGSYFNVVTVTGTPEGETPTTTKSNEVETKVTENVAKKTTEPAATPNSGVGSTSTPTPTPTPPPPPGKKGVLAICERSTPLKGASGPKRQPFTVQTSAGGIRQITFYLDGHKIKTLKQSQAKHGKFTIKINPARLSFGAHQLVAKTVMSNSNCKATPHSSVFVRPISQRVAPKFTG